jgi:DNA (cytosine-5)-methyltransferase 1
MKVIRVFEAFAGYGSQAMALKRLEKEFPDKVHFEFVGISEIDPYPIKAYAAVHGDTPNYGDISKIDWANVPDF